MEDPISEQFENRTLKVKPRIAGRRLDQYLAMKFPDYSRNAIQSAIHSKTILVNQKAVKPSYKIRAGDEITVCMPGAQGPEIPPEDIPLDIIYEDEWMVVINKAPGLVVHPARGHLGGTLVNALVHHFNTDLADTGDPLRPGIMHRLDRFTSGVIVVAKENRALHLLARQWEERTVRKEYWCLVEGVVEYDEDIVDAPIGMHPRNRKKMAISEDGRPSQTRYRVTGRHGRFSVVHAFPRTGRTHQIRVHMLSIGHPIVCDELYGRRQKLSPQDLGGEGTAPLLERLALHARRLTLMHPMRKEELVLEAPLPLDLNRALAAVQAQ